MHRHDQTFDMRTLYVAKWECSIRDLPGAQLHLLIAVVSEFRRLHVDSAANELNHEQSV